MDQPLIVGAHSPTAGGLADAALSYVDRVGAGAVQVYVSNSRHLELAGELRLRYEAVAPAATASPRSAACWPPPSCPRCPRPPPPSPETSGDAPTKPGALISHYDVPETHYPKISECSTGSRPDALALRNCGPEAAARDLGRPLVLKLKPVIL